MTPYEQGFMDKIAEVFTEGDRELASRVTGVAVPYFGANLVRTALARPAARLGLVDEPMSEEAAKRMEKVVQRLQSGQARRGLLRRGGKLAVQPLQAGGYYDIAENVVKSPYTKGTLAHELGHAADPALVSKLLSKYPPALAALGMGAGGLAASTLEDPKARWAAAALGTAASYPMIHREIVASRIGDRLMSRGAGKVPFKTRSLSYRGIPSYAVGASFPLLAASLKGLYMRLRNRD